MNAILLCAGFGTRLRPLTDDTPKALVEVAGRPILDYLMEQLVGWAPVEAVHVVHNDRHPTAFARWRDRWMEQTRQVQVEVHNNGVRASAARPGAVGDLRFGVEQVGQDVPAIVAAGDSLYRIALRPVLERFRATAAHAIPTLPVSDPDVLRQSSVLVLDDGRVQGVAHAPDAPPSRWVSPAFYLLAPQGLAHVASYLDRGGDPDTLGRFIDDLAQQQRIEAVPLAEPSRADEPLRYHINTPDEHARAQATLAEEPVLLNPSARGSGGDGEWGRR